MFFLMKKWNNMKQVTFAKYNEYLRLVPSLKYISKKSFFDVYLLIICNAIIILQSVVSIPF